MRLEKQTHQLVSGTQEETQTDQQPSQAPEKETDGKHTQGWEQVRL